MSRWFVIGRGRLVIYSYISSVALSWYKKYPPRATLCISSFCSWGQFLTFFWSDCLESFREVGTIFNARFQPICWQTTCMTFMFLRQWNLYRTLCLAGHTAYLLVRIFDILFLPFWLGPYIFGAHYCQSMHHPYCCISANLPLSTKIHCCVYFHGRAWFLHLFLMISHCKNHCHI